MRSVSEPPQSDLAMLLIPDPDQWARSRADLAALIFGVDRATAPDERDDYRLRTSTASHEQLNAAIECAALQVFSEETAWTPTRTWDLLVRTLREVSPVPPASNDDSGRWLFAAKVLINAGVPAPDEHEVLPGAMDGATLASLRGKDGVSAVEAFSESITVRKAYLTRLFGVRTVRAISLQKAQSRAFAIASAVLNAMLDVMENDARRAALAAPPVDDGDARRISRPRIRIVAGISLVAIGVCFIGWQLLMWAPQAAVGDQVRIDNVTPAPKYSGERFWVPANASLDTLPVVENYCTGVDGRDERMIDWLVENGTPQYVPQQVAVRNISHADDLITIRNVVAHGETTSEVTPGFVVQCPSGGKGGDTDWSVLKLRLEDGAVGELQTTKPSTVLLRTIGKGTSAGLMLHLNGEEDFVGTVTAELEQLDRATSVVTLPLGPAGEPTVLRWHGVPADKYLEVIPGAPGEGLVCQTSSKSDDAGEPCTPADITGKLIAIWGAEAVE